MKRLQASDWISLMADPTVELREQVSPNVRIMTSPYDKPEALRVVFKPEDETVSVEFRYMGDERTLTKKVEGFDLVYRTGKDSSRLYALEFKAAGPQLADGAARLIEQLAEAVKRAGSTIEIGRENYGLAQRAMNEKKVQLAEQLRRAVAS